MAKSRNVFISYAREDRSKIEPIVSMLRSSGVNAWVDTLSIAPGTNWQTEIEKGLKNSDALVYVASKHSAGSKWMNSELESFLGRDKRIIPVIIDDEGERSLPEALRAYQWIDLRGTFGQKIKELATDVPASTKTEPTPQTAPQSRGYVFLSYAAEDGEFVGQLRAFLAGRGYSYWDYQTGRRDYQRDYTLELEERIQQAEAVLVIMSPSWKKAEIAFKELHFAKEVRAKIFLLRISDPGPTLVTAGMTYIDFADSREQGFSQLAREMADRSL